jgi:Uma2 family endonuclease
MAVQVAVQLAKRRFTVDEYHHMAEAGILKEDEPVELIDGEVVFMSPIGKHHAGVVNRVVALLHRLLGESAVISVQNPLRIPGDVELQPDIAVLAPQADYYANELPTPADTYFVIEVADTSLVYDRDLKVPLYARGSVPEVWLVNLNENVVHVYRGPKDGAYTEARTVKRGDVLALPGVPGVTVKVDDILG